MTFPHKMLPALAVAGALLGAGCGGSDSSDDSASKAPVGNPVDRGFAADMIPHHEDAVQMAQIAQRRGSSDFIKKLADDIVKTQRAEISTLRAADQRLTRANVPEGSLGVPQHMMGMDDNPASLKTAKPFDRAFIRMMIPHHEGAVAMARAEMARGKDPELMKLAATIVTGQQREITAMRKRLGDKDNTAGAHDADSMQGDAPAKTTGDSGAKRRPRPSGRDRPARTRAPQEIPPKAQQPREAL